MHCIYNWESDVRVGPEQPPQDSGAPDQAGGGETNAGRLLAVILTERRGDLRVVTAYTLDASQKRDYLRKRALGEWV